MISVLLVSDEALLELEMDRGGAGLLKMELAPRVFFFFPGACFLVMIRTSCVVSSGDNVLIA